MSSIPTHAASFWCDTCARAYAEAELRLVPVGRSHMRMCVACGGAVHADTSRVVQPFVRTLAGAFAWPVRPPVLYWTLGLAIACAVLPLLPFGGILGACLELSFLFLVIRRTGQGSENLENQEVAEDFWDWLRPLLRYVAALLISFTPGVAVLLLGGASWFLVGVALLVAGTLYLPAAIVVAAHAGTANDVLNPVPALSLIRRVPGPYFLTVLFVAIALSTQIGISYAVAELREAFGAIPATVASPILGMYPSIVCARMLGLLIREHAEEL